MPPERPRTALWLPGWTAGPEVFGRAARRLRQLEHRFVDFRACRSASAIVAAAEEAVAAAARPPAVVGWSLGAMVALELASRGVPVARLCLVGASGEFFRRRADGAGWPPPVLEGMRRRLARDPGGLVADFWRRLFSPAELEAGWHERWLAERGDGRPAVETLAAGLDFLERFSLHPGAERVTAPVALLHGALDAACPLRQARRLAAALPEAELTVVPGAGHLPFFTEPETFERWLTERIGAG